MSPPTRFRREKREVTPFSEDPVVPEDIPAEWRHVEAPPNFTWVSQDELAGMGWPKSRDQLRFLSSQGIDHLVTLSADKIPPHYAFPEMKWSLIPVEDFHGPSMRDIKHFINIMDEARKNGEAVGVHCAEGRGRTGVMCACYLIYYHDLKPWDAIRIMRRQRPGSVERKIQEDTVVRFFHLLHDFGKQALEDLEERDKEWKVLQRRSKEDRNLQNCTNKLVSHLTSFYGSQQRPETKLQRLERMQRIRRCRSMPKMTQQVDEPEKMEINFKQHLQNFYFDRSRCKSQPRDRDGAIITSDLKEKKSSSSSSASACDSAAVVGLRAVTPVRSLVEGLKKTSARKTDCMLEEPVKQPDTFTKHFKDFLAGNTNVAVKRARSFSQPKEKNFSSNVCSESIAPSPSKDSLEDVEDPSKLQSAADSEDSGYSSAAERFLHRSRGGRGRSKDAAATATAAATSDLLLMLQPQQTSTAIDRSDVENKDSEEEEEEEEESRGERPPQPNYRPQYTIDSSTTYSYYTRVRSRAAAAATATKEAGICNASSSENVDSAPRAHQHCKDNHPSRTRAKTVDRDLCVTVTVIESYANEAASSNISCFQYLHSNNEDTISRTMESEIKTNRFNATTTENSKKHSACEQELNDITSKSRVSSHLTRDANHCQIMELRPSQEITMPIVSRNLDALASYRLHPQVSRSKFAFNNGGMIPISSPSSSFYSPFTRDNWKRTNQRFKYSRFLSAHSRETFV